VHDEPARQCFTWHILPKLPDPIHRKRDDGGDDPYSVRFICPAHDDDKPSAGISVVNDQIKYNCFVCNRQKFRLGLIRVYEIDPACLPLAASEKQDVLDYLADLLTSDTDRHAEIRLRALAAIEGYRILPGGRELERLAGLTAVSRGEAFKIRARPDPKTDNPSSKPGTESLSNRAGQRPGKKSPQKTKSPQETSKSRLRRHGHQKTNQTGRNV
jgi:hypothetical protein